MITLTVRYRVWAELGIVCRMPRKLAVGFVFQNFIFWRKFHFLSKFHFLGKISFFDQSFIFWLKFRFLTANFWRRYTAKNFSTRHVGVHVPKWKYIICQNNFKKIVIMVFGFFQSINERRYFSVFSGWWIKVFWDQKRPQSLRLFLIITSVTASNTNWILLVSVAQVKWV